MTVWRTISFLYFGTYTIVILQFLQGIVLTGPVIKRSIRMVREVYPEIEADKREGNQAEVCIVGDVVYGADEPVPSDQPCLKCKCQPPGVQCESIQCAQKQGCKAIHKSNHCCPEYQCECIHNGTIYGNGERLATLPGGECSVCFCRGGEVQCANVSCYKRSDCEGRAVSGQCCLKYDHCPLKEPSSIPRIPPTTPSAVTENSSFTAIYDDKSDITQVTAADDTPESISTMSIIQTKTDNLETDSTIPNITIQEIIPEIKEIPITTAPKQNINVLIPKTHSPIEETQVTSVDKQTTSDIVADTDSESSEISEIYHHPPPVLKIGDQLLIFKKGQLISEKDISTPVPVITIIGAEGLQRGTEDSSEYHEISSQLQGPQKDVVTLDDLYDNETLTTSHQTSHKETHIVSYVKHRTSTTPEPVTGHTSGLVQVDEDVLDDSNITYLNEGVTFVTSESTTSEPLFEGNGTGLSENVDHPTLETLQHTDVLLLARMSNTSTTITNVENHGKIEMPLEVNMSTENRQLFDEGTISSNHEVLNETTILLGIGETTVPNNLSFTFDSTELQTKNTGNPSGNLQTHILINANATLPASLLRQAAVSDIEDDSTTELGNTGNYNETQPSSKQDVTQIPETFNPETFKNISQDSADDSGESTTIRNNHTSEIVSDDNASIETTRELNTTDLVEILPGFQISTENNNSSTTEKTENGTKSVSDTTEFTSTDEPDDNLNLTSSNIFMQFNKDLNNTFNSLNYTGFKNNEERAEAIFKELLVEVGSSTLPPNANNQESSLVRLHEKESELLKKVSETITRFQSKESNEALDTRIVGILKDFFKTQHIGSNGTDAESTTAAA